MMKITNRRILLMKSINLTLILMVLMVLMVMFSCISYGYAEPKNWQKYNDKIANFSIGFPKDWDHAFFTQKEVLQAGGSVGSLANASENLMINFTVMKHDKNRKFDQVIKDSLRAKNKIYKKEDNINNIKNNARIDFCFIFDQEIYMVRQYLQITKENTLIAEIALPKASFLKKDTKYRSVVEIMDTLRKLK